MACALTWQPRRVAAACAGEATCASMGGSSCSTAKMPVGHCMFAGKAKHQAKIARVSWARSERPASRRAHLGGGLLAPHWGRTLGTSLAHTTLTVFNTAPWNRPHLRGGAASKHVQSCSLQTGHPSVAIRGPAWQSEVLPGLGRTAGEGCWANSVAPEGDADNAASSSGAGANVGASASPACGNAHKEFCLSAGCRDCRAHAGTSTQLPWTA